jgi:NAD(P)-dependent dehydrogenase (short-subunit alcohol dehydrogenase family)
MDTLERQRAVVTGGSRGFGLGIVEALVDRKAEVTVVARDPKRLSDVKGRISGRSTCRRSSSTATTTRSCRSEPPQCGRPR